MSQKPTPAPEPKDPASKGPVKSSNRVDEADPQDAHPGPHADEDAVLEEEDIDEALDESFPASDPPAWTGSIASSDCDQHESKDKPKGSGDREGGGRKKH